MPASGVDDIRHAGALEDYAGVGAPWTAEKVCTSGHGVAGGRGDSGLVDHVVASVVGCASGGGDVALRGCEDADVDLFEPSLRGLAEDEVGRALDV